MERYLLWHLFGLRWQSRTSATDRNTRLPPDRCAHDQRRPRENKGLALFPRRIGGHDASVSRIDGENLYIMVWDILHFGEPPDCRDATLPLGIRADRQLGSPLETPAGRLLLTHGVGPVRTYCIGAMLLDLNDPLKVIGCLDEPLITPTERERNGTYPMSLTVRGDGSQRATLHPLRHLRHRHPLRHALAGFPAEPTDNERALRREPDNGFGSAQKQVPSFAERRAINATGIHSSVLTLTAQIHQSWHSSVRCHMEAPSASEGNSRLSPRLRFRRCA